MTAVFRMAENVYFERMHARGYRIHGLQVAGALDYCGPANPLIETCETYSSFVSPLQDMDKGSWEKAQILGSTFLDRSGMYHLYLAHLMSPHAPFVHDAECRFKPMRD